MDVLLVVAGIALLAGPVLALVALISVRQLESRTGTSRIQELTSRVYALEQLVKQLASREVRPSRETAAARQEVPQAEPPLPSSVEPGSAASPMAPAVAKILAYSWVRNERQIPVA